MDLEIYFLPERRERGETDGVNPVLSSTADGGQINDQHNMEVLLEQMFTGSHVLTYPKTQL